MRTRGSVLAMAILALVSGCAEQGHRICIEGAGKHRHFPIVSHPSDNAIANLTGVGGEDFLNYRFVELIGNPKFDTGIPVETDRDFTTTLWLRLEIKDTNSNTFYALVGPDPSVVESKAVFSIDTKTANGPYLRLGCGWVYLWGHYPKARTGRIRAIGDGTVMELYVPSQDANSNHSVIHHYEQPNSKIHILTDDPNSNSVTDCQETTANGNGYLVSVGLHGGAPYVVCQGEWDPSQCASETKGVTDWLFRAFVDTATK